MTEASDRRDQEPGDNVHEVEFAEYSELLISRRRLERVDLEAGSLRDLESGEFYVLKKRSGLSRILKSV